MAITYPISFPSTGNAKGIRKISWRAVNGVGYNASPFNGSESIYNWNNDIWQADIAIAPQKRDEAEYWIAFLLSLRGRMGTFLLPDPIASGPRDTLVTDLTITGTLGSSSVTAVIGGTSPHGFRPGDVFQLGSGSTSRLYKILDNNNVGTRTMEIWPSLRADATAEVAVINNPKCVFRLSNNTSAWDIDEALTYGINFTAQEAK